MKNSLYAVIFRMRKTGVCHRKPFSRFSSFWFSHNGNSFQKAINDAEKLVGYPTRYSSLKFLLDDEPTNFIPLAKKLVGSGHPLLTTARDLLSQDPHGSHQLGGLWVLLLSKAATIRDQLNLSDEFVDGIHQKQRALSETTELINTAFLLHRSMIDLDNDKYTESINLKTLNFGNKLSVLGGDFLLAKASLELAKLRNTEVVEMVSQAIGDMAEGSAIEDLDHSQWTLKSWENYVYLLKGSLMANSCQAAVVLSKQDVKMQEKAFEFGKNLLLAQQSAEDIESFQNKKHSVRPSNILLITALQTSTSLMEKYINFFHEADSRGATFSTELKQDIENNFPAVIDDVKTKCEQYIERCKEIISVFPEKETVLAIKHILDTILEN